MISELVPAGEIYFRLARFLVVMAVGLLVSRIVLVPATRKLLGMRKTEKKSAHSIENIVWVFGLFLSFTLALQAGNFGNLATIIGTIAAALTVAIGFGMRDQVGSLVGGVLIQLDNPFVKGDYIKVDEYEGVVKEIRLRATEIHGYSATKMIIPNSVLTTNTVKNYTRGRRTKTSIEMTTTPENMDAIAEILEEVAKNEEEVLERPEPQVVYTKLEEGKIAAELHYWVKDSTNAKRVRSEVIERYTRKAVEQGLVSKED